MPNEFKNVPAIEKCFSILQHFAESKQELGISEISKQLELNKSTVFNIIYTLKNLEILEQYPDGKFHFGTLLYLLGNANGKKSELLQTVHPYLAKINQQTKLSAFLGIRSGQQAVIIDKVDTAHDIKISSEIGMRLPLLAGAGGKALLSQLSDRAIDQILNTNSLKKFTAKTCIDKKRFKKEVLSIRKEGIAFDDEEYIDGVVAFSAPLNTNRPDLQAAIWTVGLKQQVSKESISKINNFLKKIADEINHRFYMTTDGA
ncbi:Transcriptional regulator, IclR family [Olavius sp. associated proteobacterium Delta 1]|nr:Transcriptional regulator, IclR family [Olavius sp. associated proteobacterium Delta 1]